jgi:hypothetical protein
MSKLDRMAEAALDRLEHYDCRLLEPEEKTLVFKRLLELLPERIDLLTQEEKEERE